MNVVSHCAVQVASDVTKFCRRSLKQLLTFFCVVFCEPQKIIEAPVSPIANILATVVPVKFRTCPQIVVDSHVFHPRHVWVLNTLGPSAMLSLTEAFRATIALSHERFFQVWAIEVLHVLNLTRSTFPREHSSQGTRVNLLSAIGTSLPSLNALSFMVSAASWLIAKLLPKATGYSAATLVLKIHSPCHKIKL